MSTGRYTTDAFVLAVFLGVKFLTVYRNNSEYANILNVLLHILRNRTARFFSLF